MSPTLRPMGPLPFSSTALVLSALLGAAQPAPHPAAPTARRPSLDAPADTVREYRGTYESGFEISWFHPCGAPAGDDLWWVTLSDAALRQRDSLAKSLAGAPRSVFVRWRGSSSAKIPMGAGHMGRGSRYLLVTEILELRPAEEAGCSAA